MLDQRRIRYGAWNRRVAATLQGLGVQTWEDLAQFGEAQLLKINGFGRTSLKYVKQRMAERGVRFQCTRDVPLGLRVLSFQPVRGVYFIGCEGFVKIGYAKDIRQRMSDIALASPHQCELLGFIPTASDADSRRLEAELHRRFTADRHRLEWFKYSDAIRTYVEGSCQSS